MSKRIRVKLTDDHLKTIGKTKPIAALEELIWNSLDADANDIKINFNENELGAVFQINVTDNGHGIKYDTIESTFGAVGDSHKKSRFSPEGRLFHGKLGFGRYKIFMLGQEAIWKTITKKDGTYQLFDIRGTNSNPGVYEISDIEENETNRTGVKVTVKKITEESTNLNSPIIKEEIQKKFAAYMLANSTVKLTFSGELLDPERLIDDQYIDTVEIETDDGQLSADVQIIKWDHSTKSEIYWCSNNGVNYKVNEIKRRKRANISCYIKSNYFETAYTENKLDLIDMDPLFITLKEKVNNHIIEFLRRDVAIDAAETVHELRKKDIYPFTGEPSNPIELYEREVFDVCASHMYEYLPEFSESPKQTQQVTLKLIKVAIENNPKTLNTILVEVLDLTDEEQNNFATVLKKIKLTSMINLSRLVTDRIKTLESLEAILLDDSESERLKERSQLHKILEEEPWIFGDEWILGASDKSLKTILKSHLSILDADSLGDDLIVDEINNLGDIPDLFLHKTTGDHDPDVFHHLIVELKRPSVKISKKEMTQIEEYVQAVINTPAFDKQKTSWTFILVSKEIDKDSSYKIQQLGRPKGLLFESDDGNVKVWVYEWNQIFQPIKGRLRYLQEKIEFKDQDDSDINYIKEKYPLLFPQTSGP